eukprot:CAMPEP_0197464004 /NCGR_PEP_ID=MMETSP1175-20131217/63332_1 /TAXON_ID=1003142 /ORGANISM="Triceratium dubium, Strain CCMP147" /LENGTH=61 /DNA_ID=CAMNT_0042999901 /DNA_START=34 /DNA_END=216 /DNA_ORIENTATION=-
MAAYGEVERGAEVEGGGPTSPSSLLDTHLRTTYLPCSDAERSLAPNLDDVAAAAAGPRRGE